MSTSIRSHALCVIALLVAVAGCFKAPDISVDASGWGSRERVDSTRIPPTQSHEEAKAELRKAYSEIERLRKDKDKLKRKNDELKDENKRLKKRLND